MSGQAILLGAIGGLICWGLIGLAVWWLFTSFAFDWGLIGWAILEFLT